MSSVDERTKAIKKDFESRNIRGLALDIDETLSFSNGMYFQALIEKFGSPENLSHTEVLKKYKSTHNVPYWQTEEIKGELVKMRRDGVFHDSIAPITDAADSVREIATHIPCICYITARPESMREPTVRWLKKHGFPEIPVIMRPNEVDDSRIMTGKGPVVEYLYPNVVGIIDDNPSFLETVSKKYAGVLFLYDTDILPDTHVKTIVCPNWQDVVENVKKYAREN